jgi:Ni,Fe-hydrogenase maturation factor
MKSKITIYVFGNPLLEFDNLPLKMLPKLRRKFPKINFIEADPNENLKPINGKLIIIDTIADIDKVILFDDINKIQTVNPYTLHDLDLGLNLKLLYKIGKIKKAVVFGLPPEGNEKIIFIQLNKLINNFLNKNNI